MGRGSFSILQYIFVAMVFILAFWAITFFIYFAIAVGCIGGIYIFIKSFFE